MAHDHSADSSGIPWEGREFQPNAHAGDDGTTPESVAAAILAFRDGTGSLTELAAALAESRALIPLITSAGDDFDADNPGQWVAHCHNIYHAETGMTTVLGYQS